ncbi:MAG: hypothetical protein LBS03_03655 [Bacteroidales bacterium]|jgi:hypothetical protein|nr:hypothetical protein [Bacteroidales bacterium]
MKILFIGCIGISCLLSVRAQEVGTYGILSVNGKIVDKQTGRELVVGQQVHLQTTLSFAIASDAVVLSPSKVKYRIELPDKYVMSSVLEAPSQEVIRQVKVRPLLVTGTRGNQSLLTDLSLPSLRSYFGTDTFSVIGNSLKLPVIQNNTKNPKLLIRYEKNGVKEVKLNNLTLDKAQLAPDGNRIDECFIMLDDGKQLLPVTQVRLFFIDENRLFREFEAFFSAMEIERTDTPKNREMLEHYCTDLYGNIDRKNLKNTLETFFSSDPKK